MSQNQQPHVPSKHNHHGFKVPDPFASRSRPTASFLDTLLATAFFRCWHLLLFYGAWSVVVCWINNEGVVMNFKPTLLTVVGTALGFVISYRTTSSFERYNEGRRLWGQIILATRIFARTAWFHVPEPEGDEELRARALIEKKTALNLVEGFAVAVKHYLRGEDGIYYQDLYYLVKFLPSYKLPAVNDVNAASAYNDEPPPAYPPDTPFPDTPYPGVPTPSLESARGPENGNYPAWQSPGLHQRSSPGLPPPVTNNPRRNLSQNDAIPKSGRPANYNVPLTPNPEIRASGISRREREPITQIRGKNRGVLAKQDEVFLLPARMPPKWALFDIFPFSMFVRMLTKKGKTISGRKAQKMRAKMMNKAMSHNIPLEISLYLSSYIAGLQRRKLSDMPTANGLITALNQMVDALTGLERVLTTPIPFSYSIHIWVVTSIYCLALPPQLWPTMKWMTIPCTVIASFFFFGFLVAGEEIENPFGYDKNDLNLDHFTNNIIRNELRAITSAPPPDPERWAFVEENDLVFSDKPEHRIAPEDWVRLGHMEIQHHLSRV